MIITGNLNLCVQKIVIFFITSYDTVVFASITVTDYNHVITTYYTNILQ